MAWRFKQQSKFKNSAPKIIKKEEWLTDLPVGALMQTHGNHIKASCQYIAFNSNNIAGTTLGVLPLQCSGRQTDNLKLISAHGDLVTDFDFCPFNDCLLASCSQDCTIRLWLLPEEGLTDNLSVPTLKLPYQIRRVETVLWNPSAEGILASTIDNVVKVYDVTANKETFVSPEHGEVIQGMSWRGDGTCIATSCKDTILRLWDPRSNSGVEGKGHENMRDSRVAWVGDKDMIISTGFDNSRQRRIGLWDTRNMSAPLQNAEVDKSTSILVPFMDADTNMLILMGKGDSMMQFWEVADKEPHLTMCANDRIEQVKGVASVPKRMLEVMKGEVMRLLLLTQNHIIPVPYVVPRKTYSDFHADIFPDTASMEPSMSASQWLQGDNHPVTKVTLNPSKTSPIPLNRGSLYKSDSVTYVTSAAVSGDGGTYHSPPAVQQPVLEQQLAPPDASVIHGDMVNGSQQSQKPASQFTTRAQQPTQRVEPSLEAEHKFQEKKPQPAPITSHETKASPATPRRPFIGARKSKFRYLKGTIAHKDFHYTNLRKVGKTVPGECDMFLANPKFCGLPLDGPGGLVAVIKISQPGKLPDFGIPAVQTGVKVTDFAWDPFNNNRLIVGADDAKVSVWDLPEDGPTETLTEPQFYLKGHRERICCVKYHHLARNVLATVSHDHSVKIWDLGEMAEKIELLGHNENILCFAWSIDGRRCATVSKDGVVRVYDPRVSTLPTHTGNGPAGPRGARLVWVLGDQFVVISGFSRSAERQLTIYTSGDLVCLQTITIDNSTAILVPFYDEDSSVLLLTGRGDGTVFAYEVSMEAPHMFDLSPYRSDGMHQAFAYIPKNQCDVAEVEFAKGYRLRLNAIEPVSFTVPRVKMQLFQDDIFPDTKVLWEPTVTSSEWFNGVDRSARLLCLQPPHMKSLSDSTGVVKATPQKFESYNPTTYKTDDQKKEELLSAMNSKLTEHTGPLPQDLMEGVDSSEWDD